MEKIFLTIAFLLSCCMAGFAQNTLNTIPDSIIGEYFVKHEGEDSRVKFTKEDDGTYKCQVIWVKDKFDKNGEVRLDVKNPDKSLRKVECDRIVLVNGLKYNVKDKCWDGAKVYDPARGLRANVRCWFGDDGTLKVRGSLLGISETVDWKKEK